MQNSFKIFLAILITWQLGITKAYLKIKIRGKTCVLYIKLDVGRVKIEKKVLKMLALVSKNYNQ